MSLCSGATVVPQSCGRQFSISRKQILSDAGILGGKFRGRLRPVIASHIAQGHKAWRSMYSPKRAVLSTPGALVGPNFLVGRWRFDDFTKMAILDQGLHQNHSVSWKTGSKRSKCNVPDHKHTFRDGIQSSPPNTYILLRPCSFVCINFFHKKWRHYFKNWLISHPVVFFSTCLI